MELFSEDETECQFVNVDRNSRSDDSLHSVVSATLTSVDSLSAGNAGDSNTRHEYLPPSHSTADSSGNEPAGRTRKRIGIVRQRRGAKRDEGSRASKPDVA